MSELRGASHGRRVLWTALPLLITLAVSTSALGFEGVGVGTPYWRSRAYRIADGLPSNIVNAIAQDRDGYLWLGTSSGLVRFDGANFVLWGADVDPALPSESISAL